MDDKYFFGFYSFEERRSVIDEDSVSRFSILSKVSVS